MSYPALDIARKLIKLADDQFRFGGEKLTNMKLQKLMYYAQGYHLAAFGEKLFDDDIESWMYGPVVPSVYDYYAKYEANPLPSEECGLKMTKATENLFNYVYNFFRNFSAIGLMNRTHTESPWLEALPHNRGTKISDKSIKTYFEDRLPELVRGMVENQLDMFFKLPSDWDLYGSAAPSAKSIENARSVLKSFSIVSILKANLSPSQVGGVSIVVGDDRHNVVGCNFGDNSFSWYQRKDGVRIISKSFVEYNQQSIAELISHINS